MPTEIEIIEGQIPGLARLVEFIRLFVQNDFSLRKIQAANAPRPVFGQPINITNGQTFVLPQAASENTGFSYMVIVIDTTSGSGRYRIDGVIPATGVGFQVAAGGTIITVEGSEAIKNFVLFSDLANTLTGFCQPFQ